MIKRFFGDAEYDFKLGIDEALEWERIQRKSLYLAFTQLASGEFVLRDVREILRLALIGGGTDPVDAFALVEAYMRNTKYGALAALALEVVRDAYFEEEATAVEEA